MRHVIDEVAFDRIQFSLVYDSLDGKIKRSDNDKVKDNSPDNYPGDGFPYLRFKIRNNYNKMFISKRPS